jgi:hypothetical protein
MTAVMLVPVNGSYLLILGDREAIAWVLREEQMAFPTRSRREVDRLLPGDELFIYTTRGAYRNPTRDRGRVIGVAQVTSPVIRLNKPVEFSGRSYPRGCSIAVESLAPWGTGVELQPLVAKLSAFPDPQTWNMQLRRPLLRLQSDDAEQIRTLLSCCTTDRATSLPGYVARGKPVATAQPG